MDPVLPGAARHDLGPQSVLHRHSRKLPNPPSSYFASNIYCTFFSDAFGLRSLDDIGVDNVLFETDYPHGDSTWPDCLEVARRQTTAAGLDDEVIEKIIRGNARRLFGLDE